MAVRYSGELEVRVTYDSRSRSYRGFVNGPRLRMAAEVYLAPRADPRTGERYDLAARRMVELAERRVGRTTGAAHGMGGDVVVTREFESPCPPGTVASGDCRCRHRSPRRRRRRRRA